LCENLTLIKSTLLEIRPHVYHTGFPRLVPQWQQESLVPEEGHRLVERKHARLVPGDCTVKGEMLVLVPGKTVWCDCGRPEDWYQKLLDCINTQEYDWQLHQRVVQW